jgi:hypothetical protein
MKSSWIKPCCLALAILSVGVGCSSRTDPPAPSSQSFPTGKFTNQDWSLDFKGDGTYIASGPPGSETGTYTVSANQVVITCQCCGDVAGTYTWNYAGGTLSFKAIDDNCSNRLAVVGAGLWLQTP